MKCPKCGYVGFERSDRCRHCGYDFSLIESDGPDVDDLPLRAGDETERGPLWLRDEDQGTPPRPLGALSPADDWFGRSEAASGSADELPLFERPSGAADQPLIPVAPAPRSPLGVRRTPQPKPRVTPRVVAEAPPRLEFPDDGPVPPGAHAEPAVQGRRPLTAPAVRPAGASNARRRVIAAAVDIGILLVIDAIVVYLTLRMASLEVSGWRHLPLVPVVAFLGMVAVAYYSVFTTFGGQTIGKMATGLRVVDADDRVIDPPRAVGRTLLWGVSVAAFGLPLVPWLIGRDGLTVHDRLTHTRVVPQ